VEDAHHGGDDDDDEAYTPRPAAGEDLGAAQAGDAGEHGDAAGYNSINKADADQEDVDAAVRPEKRTLPPRMREPSKRLRDVYALMTTVDTPDEPECNICDSICIIRQDISPRWVYMYIGTMASVPSSVQPLATGCFMRL
jgi:hypothetical protein